MVSQFRRLVLILAATFGTFLLTHTASATTGPTTVPAMVTTNTDSNTYASPDVICSDIFTYWQNQTTEYCGSVSIEGGCPSSSQLNASRTIQVSTKQPSAPSCPVPPQYSTYLQAWNASCPSNSSYNHAGECVCSTGYIAYDGGCVGSQAYIGAKNNKPSSCEADPCNPTTAQQLERETLIETGKASPLALNLTYYSIHQYVGFPQWIGVYGRGWISNFDMKVIDYSSPETQPGAAPTTVGVERPGGRQFQFVAPASGNTYVNDPDVSDRLVRLADQSGATTGWTYTVASDDEVETYDASGNLASITTRAGVTETLAYSTSSTPTSVAPWPGLLISVSDSFGHQIQFVHDAQ